MAPVVLLLLLTYLLASVPFGLALGVIWGGQDVRSTGSGNIGATNVARTFGWSMGGLTLLLDAAKGAIPVLVAQWLFDSPWIIGATALIAVVAHCYPVYLEFKGGKGVATGAGVLLAVAPLATLATLAVWGLVFGLTRKSSLGALVSLVASQVFVFWLDREWMLLSVLLAVLLAWRHRDNIARLRAGTEAKV